MHMRPANDGPAEYPTPAHHGADGPHGATEGEIIPHPVPRSSARNDGPGPAGA